MKKQTQAILAEPSAKLNLEDAFEEHPFMEWISKHGKNILYGLLAVLCLLFVIFLWLSQGSAEAAVDYKNATVYFQQFEKVTNTPASQEENLENLNKILAKYPDLHSKYDGKIAQTLINRNQIEKATPFVNATLLRTRADGLEKYSDFSKITLLISTSQNKEALELSKTLQSKMISEKQKGLSQEGDDLVFAINLLRIAFLQQAIGNVDEETKAWQDWMNYSSLNSAIEPKFDTKAFASAASIFTDGNISLTDYINSRIQTLGK